MSLRSSLRIPFLNNWPVVRCGRCCPAQVEAAHDSAAFADGYLISSSGRKRYHLSAPRAGNNVKIGSKIGKHPIFDAEKIQKTMNKVMGVKDPNKTKKVTYKPGLKTTSYGAGVSKLDFPTVKGARIQRGELRGDEAEDPDKVFQGPTPGNLRRARQLSDVMYLYIAEMIHSGGVHPIFAARQVEIRSVKMLPDMRNVQIRWAMKGDPAIDAEIAAALQNEAGWEIRRQLAALKIMGRVPDVMFLPDDSRLQLNQVFNLIEIAEKPPEDDQETTTTTTSKPTTSDPAEDADDPDLNSQRISSFRFPANSPTWREMTEAVFVVRDSHGLDQEHFMNLVLKDRASVAASAVAVEEDWGRPPPTTVGESDGPSEMGLSWKFHTESKDELSKFLKDRSRRIARDAAAAREGVLVKFDDDDDIEYRDDRDYDDFDDGDYDDDDCR